MDQFSMVMWQIFPLFFFGYLLSVSLAVLTLDTDITLKQIAVVAVIGNLLSLVVGSIGSGLAQILYAIIRDSLLVDIMTKYGLNFILQLLNLKYVGRISWKAGLKISLLSTLILLTIVVFSMPWFVSQIISAP